MLLCTPERADSDIVDGQRGLQLPTTIHRLFGTAVIEAICPSVDLGLGESHATGRGGTCNSNIRAAFAHLNGLREYRDAHHFAWTTLLRPLASIIDRVALAHDDHRFNMVVAADEEKLSNAWPMLGST